MRPARNNYCTLQFCNWANDRGVWHTTTDVCQNILYRTFAAQINQYKTVLYNTVLYCVVIYCTVVCTVLYGDVMYCAVRSNTVLYCTALCSTILSSNRACWYGSQRVQTGHVQYRHWTKNGAAWTFIVVVLQYDQPSRCYNRRSVDCTVPLHNNNHGARRSAQPAAPPM